MPQPHTDSVSAGALDRQQDVRREGRSPLAPPVTGMTPTPRLGAIDVLLEVVGVLPPPLPAVLPVARPLAHPARAVPLVPGVVGVGLE
jgi:hypothetical protein